MLGFSSLASAPLSDDGAIIVYLINADGIVTGQVVIGSPAIVQDQALSGDGIATGLPVIAPSSIAQEQAEFEVTYADASIETFPNDAYIRVQIVDDIT